ncbi:MAG: 3-methyl-2-oxobutanoate hydroxymethyltransferase [Alphaproteobacteria bacterium]|nr:3-methyl-2-oxobutanoate hydroxymethyltransferase [Alphaproteobacteria bacterium]
MDGQIQRKERRGIHEIVKAKARIVCLTAYTTSVARLLDPHVDMILVGDSVGMVVYGFDNTLSVTLDMMIAHGAAVMRGSSRAVVIVDLPYGTYEESPEQALRSASRVMQETGCSAVKLEGGAEMAPTVARLVKEGIPVVGHIGLMPQSIEKIGGFKVQGRDEAQAEKLKGDARAIAEAGAFAIIVEGTVEPVAKDITQSISIPTIGIGASVACDGQILVTDDILGLTGKSLRFVKRYAGLDEAISKAAENYAADVRARRFPGPEHCFQAK